MKLIQQTFMATLDETANEPSTADVFTLGGRWKDGEVWNAGARITPSSLGPFKTRQEARTALAKALRALADKVEIDE